MYWTDWTRPLTFNSTAFSITLHYFTVNHTIHFTVIYCRFYSENMMWKCTGLNSLLATFSVISNKNPAIISILGNSFGTCQIIRNVKTHGKTDKFWIKKSVVVLMLTRWGIGHEVIGVSGRSFMRTALLQLNFSFNLSIIDQNCHD